MVGVVTMTEEVQAVIPVGPAEADDVADGTGEETFDAGMRNNAMEYSAADDDGDRKLDFREFCGLVRDREVGAHSQEELAERFAALDGDGSGKVDMHEYLRFSLRDALSRSSTRVLEIFHDWDEDGSGRIDRREFRRAIKSLGFNTDGTNDHDIDLVFDEFDTDASGTIEYAELNKKLRQFSGIEAVNKHALRRVAGGRKGAALSTTVKIDPHSETPVAEQLRDILVANAVRVIDLFRDWDEDGNGLIDKKEFRKGCACLGLDVERAAYDALFDSFDADGGGTVEYAELNKLLRRQVDVAAVKKQRRRRRGKGAHGGPPAPAYGNKADARYGGYRGFGGGGMAKSGAWDASFDVNTNTWCLPALDRRYAMSIDDASSRWLMPMKGGNWRKQQLIPGLMNSQRPQPSPPLPMFGAGYGSVTFAAAGRPAKPTGVMTGTHLPSLPSIAPRGALMS